MQVIPIYLTKTANFFFLYNPIVFFFLLQVLELLRRRGECSEENFDAIGLLQTLYLVKMDSVDGKLPGAAGKQDQVKTNAADCGSSPTASNTAVSKNSCNHKNETKNETEMRGER